MVTAARVGYGRVSTVVKSVAAQQDALWAAGCDLVFVGHASGKLASGVELNRPGVSGD
ncbi:hypothetical protein TPB0596_10270 [Tsukamurella pulmonis]|nr:hypothetical protein TPB0596_10270 [Tsukamurella pulmonis]